ncbi:MAG TPA: hypothetical protein VNY81_06045 [Candidatus Saccharimonadales bacterium]|jgi:hypothetical protein|nr:hypothetical protein [Candidatus Saccharimonadales bacterium]
MSKLLTLTLGFLLVAGADIPGSERLRSLPASPGPSFSSSDEISVLPDEPEQQQSGQADTQNKSKSATLQESSKLDLIRYVSGEFAKATRNLPAGKEGFLVYVGKPLSPELLERAVATHGAAVHIGDSAQITKLEFHDHSIAVDVNGGGRGKKRWRDHIQIGMGGTIPTARTTTTTDQENGPPGMQPGMGSTIFLEFSKSIPDLTPEELKKLLGPFLDFAKQRSASVHWVDTLPPETKKAIQERRPAVGMDREEVVAAIGKPEHKVRERDSEGNEIEDWIYGQPPSKTVFVRFMGDRVTSIKQYPQ